MAPGRGLRAHGSPVHRVLGPSQRGFGGVRGTVGRPRVTSIGYARTHKRPRDSTGIRRPGLDDDSIGLSPAGPVSGAGRSDPFRTPASKRSQRNRHRPAGLPVRLCRRLHAVLRRRPLRRPQAPDTSIASRGRRELKNHFAEPWVGARYAEARPNIHTVVADEIARHVGRIARALDLGSGTGLSTRALLAHSTDVVGLDPSRAMLRAATREAGGAFVRGRAELLPFPAASFQLVTIGCAYHWCDREQLFSETDRVLAQDGWFAIFDSEFLGVVESPALIEWLRNDYWGRLPPCPRNPLFDPSSHLRPPFALTARSSPEARVAMTADAIRRFITTQASTVNAVTSGAASLAELEERLREGLRSHCPAGRPATARFSNPLWLLRKRHAPGR